MPEATEPPDAAAPRGSQMLTLGRAIVGVIVAVPTVLAGYYGWQANKIGVEREELALETAQLERDNAQLGESEKDARGQINDLNRENADLQSQVDALMAETAELRAAAGRSTAVAPSADQPDVRAQGSLTLGLESNQAAANLDEDRENYSWGRNIIGTTRSPDLELTNDATKLRVYAGANAVVIGTEEPSYATCTSSSGYSSEYINRAALPQGTWLCVFTSEKRYATLRVAEVYDEAIALEVVTYERV